MADLGARQSVGPDPHRTGDQVSGRTGASLHHRPPWAVAPMQSTLAVPLSAVIAFRPDPAIRRRWQQVGNELFSLEQPQE